MIIDGNHSDRNGNNIKRVIRTTSARRKRTTPRPTVCRRNPGVLAMITNRFIPTGGVINPTSTRSTDFILPKSPVSRAFRDAVRDPAEDYPFARRLLTSEPNLVNANDVYEMLIDTQEQSRTVNARLILLLANPLGDTEVLAEAARIARKIIGD